jgi:tetratricopeptide (TPR) repeat protein
MTSETINEKLDYIYNYLEINNHDKVTIDNNESIEIIYDLYKNNIQKENITDNIILLYFGIYHFIKKDYKIAIDLYKKSAEAESSVAMWNIGICYHNGYGIEENHESAVKWYMQAAKLEQPDAMVNLAYCCYYGCGIAKDQTKMLYYYKNAADLKNVMAMCNLGQYHGYTNNHDESIKWYRKAAELGHVLAINKLADIYFQGINVEKNYLESIEWYKKSAALGDAFAMNKLGDHYCKGIKVEKDFMKAMKWYKMSEAKGNDEATKNLKMMFKKNFDEIVEITVATYLENIDLRECNEHLKLFPGEDYKQAMVDFHIKQKN